MADFTPLSADTPQKANRYFTLTRVLTPDEGEGSYKWKLNPSSGGGALRQTGTIEYHFHICCHIEGVSAAWRAVKGPDGQDVAGIWVDAPGFESAFVTEDRSITALRINGGQNFYSLPYSGYAIVTLPDGSTASVEFDPDTDNSDEPPGGGTGTGPGPGGGGTGGGGTG